MAARTAAVRSRKPKQEAHETEDQAAARLKAEEQARHDALHGGVARYAKNMLQEAGFQVAGTPVITDDPAHPDLLHVWISVMTMRRATAQRITGVSS